MPANQLASGLTTVQFSAPPLRQGGAGLSWPQVDGRDSAGNVYVYRKGTVGTIEHRLSVAQVTDAVLASLLAFHGTTVLGTRNAFTWYDHLGASHTVRFASPQLAHAQTAPGRHRVEFALIEEVTL